MPEKMILIDGHSLIYRAFHALPLLDDGNGVYTNAVYGFFSMLMKVLAEQKPDYCAVAFDLHGPTFRHDSFSEYKKGRAPTPIEMIPQVPVIQEILGQMRLPILTLERFEADDILGTVSLDCEAKGIDALLVTGDRDSFQLAGKHTNILYTKRGITDTERVTVDSIREKYGVKPAQLIDIKGLMGDKSDNIPGVPGIGEKTAVKLICEYGTLERALETADAEQKGKLRERLIEHASQASLSKQLATIDRHAPLQYDLQDLRWPDISGARPLIEKLKLKTLLPRFDQLAQKRVTAPAQIQDAVPSEWRAVEYISELDQFVARARLLKSAGEVAISMGNYLSVAGSNGVQLAVPLVGDLLTPGIPEEEVLRVLAPLLSNQAKKTVYNIKVLLKTLESVQISLNGPVHDVYLAAYCLNPQRKSFALGELLPGDYEADAPAKAMLDLAAAQREEMERDGLEELYQTIELPLAYTLYGMEREGFLVDEAELKRLGADYKGRIETLTAQIYALAGRAVNINSPKQLGELLFEELRLTGGKKTSSGYSTAADILEQVADQHEIVPLILEYRKYAKLMNTYVEALLRLQGADGRIHTSFDQTATATGRISSQEPNLQNIPIRTELGREIRKAFVARPGWQLVDADYSQIELRVLAHMSGDATMQDAFLHSQDIHRRTAAEVYAVALEEVTGDMRSNAKAVNFGIVYGISDFGLARNIGVTRKEAGEFIERYLSRYPGIKRFMDDAVITGKTQGYVTTLFGRRRYLPEISNANYNIRSFGERAAMNSPIQGTAADIIKLAMVRVYAALKEKGYRARLILQVHDELIIESPPEELDAVKALLKECMETTAILSTPLKVDLSVGGNWYVCKA